MAIHAVRRRGRRVNRRPFSLRYSLKLNRKTDALIIDKLEAKKASSGSVQGYIKGLIQNDIAPQNAPRDTYKSVNTVYKPVFQMGSIPA